MPENDPITESLTEFYDWVEALPLDQAEIALKGLLEYEKAVLQERSILMGWEAVIKDE